ncbi:MAG: aminotransferase class V-fold PLP-dependent enzyme, partial [Dehalococcoidia bacterium]|nr:aminotransferase class V-fold PLP-dependent enzyme [Dehalococcoidia bacterium]
MTTTFDINKIRDDFPILKQRINGNPLVYLDNGATSQKPQSVIDAIVNYYTTTNSNVHRGVHTMSQQATDGYEGARSKIRQFINAEDDKEIIYTRNTTEGINLVAHSYGRQNVGPGDDIIVSNMEHHSNIVPWQMLCEEKGANLLVVPIDDTGELVMDEYEKMLSSRSKLVSITHVSNA